MFYAPKCHSHGFTCHMQVQECLEQNGELRAQLNQLREEQITIAAAMPKHLQASFVLDSETGSGAGNEGTLQFEARSSEEVKLKV
jgi:hypothetical protein